MMSHQRKNLILMGLQLTFLDQDALPVKTGEYRIKNKELKMSK